MTNNIFGLINILKTTDNLLRIGTRTKQNYHMKEVVTSRVQLMSRKIHQREVENLWMRQIINTQVRLTMTLL